MARILSKSPPSLSTHRPLRGRRSRKPSLAFVLHQTGTAPIPHTPSRPSEFTSASPPDSRSAKQAAGSPKLLAAAKALPHRRRHRRPPNDAPPAASNQKQQERRKETAGRFAPAHALKEAERAQANRSFRKVSFKKEKKIEAGGWPARHFTARWPLTVCR